MFPLVLGGGAPQPPLAPRLIKKRIKINLTCRYLTSVESLNIYSAPSKTQCLSYNAII